MRKITVHKEKVTDEKTGKAIVPFVQIAQPNIGEAAGLLKPCGLKLYIYLCCNKDGYEWNLNVSAYRNWLKQEGVSDAGIRKAIRDGIEDLLDKHYMKQVDEGEYEFSEKRFA